MSRKIQKWVGIFTPRENWESFYFHTLSKMELPFYALHLVREFSRPLSRPDWRTCKHEEAEIMRDYLIELWIEEDYLHEGEMDEAEAAEAEAEEAQYRKMKYMWYVFFCPVEPYTMCMN